MAAPNPAHEGRGSRQRRSVVGPAPVSRSGHNYPFPKHAGQATPASLAAHLPQRPKNHQRPTCQSAAHGAFHFTRAPSYCNEKGWSAGPLVAGLLGLSILPQPTHLLCRKFTAGKPKSPLSPLSASYRLCDCGYAPGLSGFVSSHVKWDHNSSLGVCGRI